MRAQVPIYKSTREVALEIKRLAEGPKGGGNPGVVNLVRSVKRIELAGGMQEHPVGSASGRVGPVSSHLAQVIDVVDMREDGSRRFDRGK